MSTPTVAVLPEVTAGGASSPSMTEAVMTSCG
ncbi:hypothetical protein ACVWW1_002112 [Bradyrhizobium sp. JR3.5]